MWRSRNLAWTHSLSAKAILVLLALAGCSGVDGLILPREEFASRTSDSCGDDCPPGLFSGEDGVLTIYGTRHTVARQSLPVDARPAPAAARPVADPPRNELIETEYRPDGTVIERRIIVRDGTAPEIITRERTPTIAPYADILDRPLPPIGD